MPKPYGTTQRGKVEFWIRKNAPTLVFTKQLALELGVSTSSVLDVLRKLKANGWYVKRRAGGRNSHWHVKPIIQKEKRLSINKMRFNDENK